MSKRVADESEVAEFDAQHCEKKNKEQSKGQNRITQIRVKNCVYVILCGRFKSNLLFRHNRVMDSLTCCAL